MAPTPSPHDGGVGRGPGRGETHENHSPPLPSLLLARREEREKTRDPGGRVKMHRTVFDSGAGLGEIARSSINLMAPRNKTGLGAFRGFLCFMLLCGATRFFGAAPPPNDTCDGAEVILPAGPFPWVSSVIADISDATTAGDPPAPSCAADQSRSLWYRFTPATTSLYTFASGADTATT